MLKSIEEARSAGFSQARICSLWGVSDDRVHRWRARLHESGTLIDAAPVSRKWIDTLCSVEETSTQVQVIFKRAGWSRSARRLHGRPAQGRSECPLRPAPRSNTTDGPDAVSSQPAKSIPANCHSLSAAAWVICDMDIVSGGKGHDGVDR